MKKLLTFLILAYLPLNACKKGSENFTSTVTLLNAGIDIPAITLNLNNNPLIANIAFDSIKYNVSNSSGTFALSFTNTNTGAILYSVNTGFAAASKYTAIIYDSLNPSFAANSAKLYFKNDILPTSVTDGKCSIRFFNLVPDTMSSTGHIYVKIDTGTAVVYGKYYFTGRSFGDFNNSNAFAEADTTTKWLKVVKDSAFGIAQTLDSTQIGLKNGKIYSLYFIGAYGGTSHKKPHLVLQQHN